MTSLNAMGILKKAGYGVKFENGLYTISIDGLKGFVSILGKLELVTLAKELVYVA